MRTSFSIASHHTGGRLGVRCVAGRMGGGHDRARGSVGVVVRGIRNGAAAAAVARGRMGRRTARRLRGTRPTAADSLARDRATWPGAVPRLVADIGCSFRRPRGAVFRRSSGGRSCVTSWRTTCGAISGSHSWPGFWPGPSGSTPWPGWPFVSSRKRQSAPAMMRPWRPSRRMRSTICGPSWNSEKPNSSTSTLQAAVHGGSLQCRVRRLLSPTGKDSVMKKLVVVAAALSLAAGGFARIRFGECPVACAAILRTCHSDCQRQRWPRVGQREYRL